MGDKPNLLVIDDEIGICEGIQRVLEPESFQVDIALEGMTGLDLVRRNGYDLILIDVKMPQISGLDLIPLIHEVDPEIICIIITGYATVEMAVSAIKQGAYDFLTKPFSIDTLLLAVNQGLERRKLSVEAKRTAQVEAEARALSEEKDRLLALDQAKKQFIRLVTHELKAPVSAIETYLTLILKGYVPPDKQKEILEKCVTRAREERRLIDDLLELGQLESAVSFQLSPVNPGDVLQEVVAEFQEEVKLKRLNLVLESEQEIPEIRAVPEQIKSLWSNLISNAVKYTPPEGRITVSLGREGNWLMGEVKDTGIGISQEDCQRIFSEFFRAKNAVDCGVPGTGLGLVIVKRVVESLGGTIKAESELDRGTTFRFQIPINWENPLPQGELQNTPDTGNIDLPGKT
jgi:two-component system sensor histidine kinase/response regulator